MSESNGQKPGTATLILEMDMLTHTLKVSGDAPNLDTFLAMLAQATRDFEVKAKIEAAKVLQAQLLEQQENARVAQLLRK